ncbi:MAG TPA: hypothetical protein VGB13_03700 [Candidatus Krumholzibacteria bacterium]
MTVPLETQGPADELLHEFSCDHRDPPFVRPACAAGVLLLKVTRCTSAKAPRVGLSARPLVPTSASGIRRLEVLRKREREAQGAKMDIGKTSHGADDADRP